MVLQTPDPNVSFTQQLDDELKYQEGVQNQLDKNQNQRSNHKPQNFLTAGL